MDTNIIFVDVGTSGHRSWRDLTSALAARGIVVSPSAGTPLPPMPFPPTDVTRLVTHLGIDDAAVEATLEALRDLKP